MEKFIELYNIFKDIMNSYNGDKTDWLEKYNELCALKRKINYAKVQSSKNSSFYYWIKLNLLDDVERETDRIYKKTIIK